MLLILSGLLGCGTRPGLWGEVIGGLVLSGAILLAADVFATSFVGRSEGLDLVEGVPCLQLSHLISIYLLVLAQLLGLCVTYLVFLILAI